VPVAAALAGLVDAHAAASSAATLHAAGRASGPVAALAVLTSNAVTKLTLAFTAGTRRFALEVGAGLLLGLAAAWSGFLLLPGG
jgi:uncharacterized membrane protein (DUF4010 family)